MMNDELRSDVEELALGICIGLAVLSGSLRVLGFDFSEGELRPFELCG